MGLEAATWLDDLVTTNPVVGDQVSAGDDHLRLLKTVLKATFPSAGKAFRFPNSETKAANYTVVSADQNKLFSVDASAAARTLTLPTLAAADVGWTVFVQKSDSSANAVIVAPASGTIQGAASFSLTTQYFAGRLFWTGTAWLAFVMPSLNTSVLAIGDYGLGGNAVLSNDWDAIVKSGFYYNDNSGATGVPLAVSNLVVTHISVDSTRAVQIALRSGDSNFMWVRRKSSSTWQAWVRVTINYEEGTFTPVATFNTPGDLSVAYTVQVGRYTRRGNRVSIICNLNFTPTYTTANGDFHITGLPFTALADINTETSLSISNVGGIDWLVSDLQLMPRIDNNTAFIEIQRFRDGTSTVTCEETSFPSGTAITLRITGEYEIAA